MNTGQILKQAFSNVRTYRALWVFGILLALVTFSWPAASMFGRDDSGRAPVGPAVERRPGETWGDAFQRTWRGEIEQVDRALDELLAETLDLQVESSVVTIGVVLLSIALLLYLAGRVARYVCEAALISMVDRHQQTGEMQTARQGWRLGWSHTAWRLFVIELLINLLIVAGSLLLFALIFSPLPLWVGGSESTVIIGALITAGLFFLAILLVILAALLVALLKLLSRRACAVEGLGVTASVYRGYTLLRRHLKPVLPFGLVMLAVNAVWPAVFGLAVLLLFAVALLLGGLPALLLSWLASASTVGDAVIAVVAVLASVLLIVLLAAPLLWLDGMRQVFLSSMWTLAYRDLRELDRQVELAAAEAPLPELPPLEG